MANPANLTVTPLARNASIAQATADVIDTTGTVPVLPVDTAGAPERIVMLVTSKRDAQIVTVLAGDDPPATRAALGNYTVTMSAPKAMLTTALAGANNDLTYTAVAGGLSGNAITVTYVDPAGKGAALGVVVVANAITVNLATASDVAASYETALAGEDNDIIWTAVTAGVGGNAITIVYLDPGGAGALGVGVVANAITVTLAHDGAAITSTAADVRAAVNVHAQAGLLVQGALVGAGAGAGLVTALAVQSLAGGSVGGAITSTAAQVAAAIAGTPAAAALVTAANPAGSTGLGVVTAMVAAALTGGAEVTRLLGPFMSDRFGQSDAGLNVSFDVTGTGTFDVWTYRLPRL